MKLFEDYFTKLGGDFFKLQDLEKTKNPQLLVFNSDLAREIGFFELFEDSKDRKNLQDLKSDFLDIQGGFLANILCGNELIKGSKPLAMAYAGHQFGHFVPQLGDGRAVLLGEIEIVGESDSDSKIDSQGDSQSDFKVKSNSNCELLDIALKGSGKTYFSRGGDGKCPLFAAVKEYIFSEFLHYLGIKTTRSLGIVKSDEFVFRQDGPEPGAVISRIAKSHIRIGTFQYFAAQGDFENVKKLADYAINRHYFSCLEAVDPYFEFFKQASMRQIELVSSWMSFGFIHGVMNSDNILICGQAIDFGPCAFMEKFNQGQVFSSIDVNGRYAYDQQKQIILWNLARLGESIAPFACDGDVEKAVKMMGDELSRFSDVFDDLYYQKMAKKIAIDDFKDEDRDLIDDFLDILAKNQLDFTNSFRNLTNFSTNQGDKEHPEVKKWSIKWLKRVGGQDQKKIAEIMDSSNPYFVPRNYSVIRMVQKAVNGDIDELQKFLNLIKKPYLKSITGENYTRIADNEESRLRTFCGT